MNDARINWTQIGAEHTATEEARERLQREIDNMAWFECTPGMAVPMMQGMALQRAIAEYGAAGVRAVSFDGGIGPMALLGIEKQYKNGRARIYLLDDGSELTPVRTDFWPNESAGMALKTVATSA